MYVFYADESGFSKGSDLEADQPITVVAGVLIDLTKLPKAIRIFDETLRIINQGNPEKPITELKFSDIRQGKGVFRKNFPKIEARADLLKSVIEEFEREIAFKIFYTAVVDEKFMEAKKNDMYSRYVKQALHHPYLCAAYRVLVLLEKHQRAKKNNKGKTFVIFDEQNTFRDRLEQLVSSPIHGKPFEQIFDTVYFGKSHYSKLIQIADLIAGMLRYYFWREYTNKTGDYWFSRMGEMIKMIEKNVIEQECFEDHDLHELYKEICIKKPRRSSEALR